MGKYLDNNGLNTLWTKAKNTFAPKDNVVDLNSPQTITGQKYFDTLYSNKFGQFGTTSSYSFRNSGELQLSTPNRKIYVTDTVLEHTYSYIFPEDSGTLATQEWVQTNSGSTTQTIYEESMYITIMETIELNEYIQKYKWFEVYLDFYEATLSSFGTGGDHLLDIKNNNRSWDLPLNTYRFGRLLLAKYESSPIGKLNLISVADGLGMEVFFEDYNGYGLPIDSPRFVFNSRNSEWDDEFFIVIRGELK